MPFLYCTIKLLACICSQVVFLRTFPLAPSGGDRWFCADRKMRLSEYKGNAFTLLSESILFKVPKTSAYGRFLNAKRSWRFWGVRNSLGGVKWQAIFLTWRSNSPPLIPKTLTLAVAKSSNTHQWLTRFSSTAPCCNGWLVLSFPFWIPLQE